MMLSIYQPFYYAECGVAEKLLELAESDTILNNQIQVNISALQQKIEHSI